MALIAIKYPTNLSRAITFNPNKTSPVQFDSAEYLYEKQRYLISWYPYIKVVNSPIGGAVVKAQMDAAEVGRILFVPEYITLGPGAAPPPPPTVFVSFAGPTSPYYTFFCRPGSAYTGQAVVNCANSFTNYRMWIPSSPLLTTTAFDISTSTWAAVPLPPLPLGTRPPFAALIAGQGPSLYITDVVAPFQRMSLGPIGTQLNFTTSQYFNPPSPPSANSGRHLLERRGRKLLRWR